MKLDFCRMTLAELTGMMKRVVDEDRRDPETYRPVVAIGHTKDLTDAQTVDDFLAFLRASGIGIATFESAYSKLLQGVGERPLIVPRRSKSGVTVTRNQDQN
jgi:hypothetical protein